MKERIMGVIMTLAVLITTVFSGITGHAAPKAEEVYEIYPTPRLIEYAEDETVLRESVNVVYDTGIDDYTKARLQEVADLKNLPVSVSDKIDTSKTNILVGIQGSEGPVDQYVKENLTVKTTDLYKKTDAYLLHVESDVITVLGKDTDAAFYGLTTLYHILQQIDEYNIRNLHIEDYADVVSRGFIEGYYGNPWSTEDRVNLMKWGGYYKLNSYFYAPKDDPKHNAKWRELYTDQEIEEKIKPLGQAGNESKCRFVFALHPYMNNPIRYNTEENYQADLKVMQDKFAQVIEKGGVRQIAILADDANNVGGANYIRTLNDMTDWLKEMQKTYPDLKLTLPFCTQEYMSNGHSYYGDFPENVQIVMTGGKVWGEVSNSFTTTFTNNTGRGPYMWINWPCTDNSKKHLIMGGYTTFLQPGVDPAKIQGIVLNPMQQSEPSKAAIFGNACYSWNIWESAEEADRAWEASFDYVDHNSARSTEASTALRELSKHMINQNMDNRVTPLQESVVLKEKLNPFKEKMNNDTLTNADIGQIDDLIGEFKTLQTASQTYRAGAGNAAVRDQIVYWLNCWDDTTNAAITYLEAIKAILNGDNNAAVNKTFEADAAFQKSKTYGFHYVDHTEYAEVGVQHIVPFIQAMDSYMSMKTETALDPNAVVAKFITNRKDVPVGSMDAVFDSDDASMVSYRNPNLIKTGEYVGVQYNKEIPVNDIRFLLGTGKNHFDYSKLEYTVDGQTWQDIQLVNKENSFTATQGQYLEVNIPKENLPENFSAMGIRLTATQDNRLDAYLNVHEITVNKKEAAQRPGEVTYTVMRTPLWKVAGGKESNLYDGNDNTSVYYDPDGDGNTTTDDFMVGDYLGYDLGSVQRLASAHVVIGDTAKIGDKIIKYAIETSEDNITWTPVKGYENYTGKDNAKDVLDIDLENVSARYIRIRVTERRGSWGYFSEFTVVPATNDRDTEHVYANFENELTATIEKGEISLNPAEITLKKDEFVGVTLDNIKNISEITTSELAEGLVLETSMNGIEWKEYKSSEATHAYYVRVRNTRNTDVVFNNERFSVSFSYIDAKSVKNDQAIGDKNRDMRSAGTVNNVFDNNLSTFGSITAVQDPSKPVTFDYGQVIHFNKIRYYVKETSLDFLRHAKFEVSVDGKEWTEVLVVGKETENTQNDLTAKDADYLTHDSTNPGNMYQEATGLDADGRYIRVTPITPYSHRWMDFGEIQINDGAYVSPESNYDILSDAIEVAGKIPGYMLDNNFATSYKSSAENSSFVYRISKPGEANKTVRLIQKGKPTSAKVSVRYEGERVFTDLGKLSQAINEFKLSGNALEIKVSWEKAVPEILEILLLQESAGDVSKDALKAELDGYQADPAWTKDSRDAYDTAREVAEEMLKNENVSQSSVDAALGALVTARQNAQIRMNEETAAKIGELIKDKIDNSEGVYTQFTYEAYLTEYNKLLPMKEGQENITQEAAAAAVSKVEAAIEGLKFSTRNRELAQFLLDAEPEMTEGDYTTASWQAFAQAKAALESKIQESSDTGKVHPAEMKESTDAYKQALSDLVNVAALKTLIGEFNPEDSYKYTDDSFEKYQNAIEAGKKLLANGTKQEVADAAEKIAEAKKGLILIDGNLAEMIKDAKNILENQAGNYTEESLNALQAAVDQAENPNGQSEEELLKALHDAKKNLVNIQALNDVISRVEKLEKDKYTSGSMAVVDKLYKEALKLKVNGTVQQVNDMVTKLDTAIKDLDVRVSEKVLNDYRNSIVLKDASLYTKDSYQKYLNAYHYLMNLDAKNTSAEVFRDAKEAFEKAEAGLVLLGSDSKKDSQTVKTGDHGNMTLWLAVMGIALVLAAGTILKKREKDLS